MKMDNCEVKVSQYPAFPLALAADCIVFSVDSARTQDGLFVLLVKRGCEPCKGMWALPGGFMRADETIEECAARELRDAIYLALSIKGRPHAYGPALTQLDVFSATDRDLKAGERVVSVPFYAIMQKAPLKSGDDAVEAGWFSFKDLRKLNAYGKLAFDHYQMIEAARKKLREQLHFKPVAFELLPKVFSMSQVQNVYAAILDTDLVLDRRNFRSKMARLGIVKMVEDSERPANARSNAYYYKFDPGKYNKMKESGVKLEFYAPKPMNR